MFVLYMHAYMRTCVHTPPTRSQFMYARTPEKREILSSASCEIETQEYNKHNSLFQTWPPSLIRFYLFIWNIPLADAPVPFYESSWKVRRRRLLVVLLCL